MSRRQLKPRQRTEAHLKLENTLFQRQKSYLAVFDPTSPVVQEILKDLAEFCRAEESTWDPDARRHAAMEGRREVWLRIQDHIKLTSQALWEKYTGFEY